MDIMIIEDDKIIREELNKLLKSQNYTVICITDFENIEKQVKENPCKIILLDINLPISNGFEICKKIQQEQKIPILFVTSRNTDDDELKSIKSGGTDFITKPYNKIILLEKIKRALSQKTSIDYSEITIKGVTLNLHLSTIHYQDKEAELTRNEFRILYYFFLNPKRCITKDELIEYLWNDKYYLDENILMVNINRLRKKLEEIKIDNFIQTIRGEGYQL